jgi:flagellar biosynthesis/type III secretory pathway chaperone
MSIHELSALLWKERELLETLVFKLDEEQLLLTAGKTRWLERATRETELVEVSAVADEWGGSEDATLRDLVALAPDAVWEEILESHLTGLLELVGQLTTLRDQNVRLLRAASRATQEAIANLNIAPSTYDSRGFASTGSADARLIDKDI